MRGLSSANPPNCPPGRGAKVEEECNQARTTAGQTRSVRMKMTMLRKTPKNNACCEA